MRRSPALCLVGFGWFAEQLVRRVFATMPEVSVVAAVDRDPGRRSCAVGLGLAAAASLDEVMAATEIDAVVILTPHDTHRALVLEASERGLHVFCEKAFAVTAVDCIDMIAACRRNGVHLVVGHMQRLFPTHARAIELATSGAYGRVVAIQVHGMHWCPTFPGWWRTRSACGGLLHWTGIHDLDTIRALVGSDAISTLAMAGPKIDDRNEYEDSIAALIRHANGAVTSLAVTNYDPLRTFEDSFDLHVLFEHGSMAISPGAGTVTHATRNGDKPGQPSIERFGTFAEIEEQAYRHEFRLFADLLRNGVRPMLHGVPALDPVEALRCVELLEAIERSVASGAIEIIHHHEEPVT